MKTKIICKKVNFDTQAFYAVVDGKEYFLFEQAYKSSVREFFKYGYYLTDSLDYSKLNNEAVMRTLNKIPSYIKYIENEFGIACYEKTKRKQEKINKKFKVKRINYLTQRECMAYAVGY